MNGSGPDAVEPVPAVDPQTALAALEAALAVDKRSISG